MTGRTRAPYEVLIAKGDTSNGPLPICVDRVPGPILPPDWLTGDALICWHHLSEILTLRGQLSRDSFWSVVSFCTTWAEWLDLRRDIAENGRVMKILSSAGQKVKATTKRQGGNLAVIGIDDDDVCYIEKIRPQVMLFSDADKRLRNWLQEFGLTDASRSKVGKPENPPPPLPTGKQKGKQPSPADYGLSH